MTYAMIERKRDAWYAKPDCPARQLVDYMERRGCMRDAQVGAIKTYLYLKIAHGCRPLAELYSEGAFNSLDLEELEVSTRLRDAMAEDSSLAALYEYLDDDEIDARGLIKDIRKNPDAIDAQRIFRDIFYNVGYADYVFSLPMGAGKTYLMAAFIYLDLYFSRMDPGNAAFASNFVVFAPSGLKSSVVPSLKKIKEFDPSWIIPEPAASELRSALTFEVLDAQKSGSKSNRVKNPNVQKVAIHQPFKTLAGLVLVTNAEKVILSHVQTDDSGNLQMDIHELDDAGVVENELRDIVSRARTEVEVTSVDNLDFSSETTSYESVIPHVRETPVTFRKWKHDLLHETGPVAAGLTKFASSVEGDGRLRNVFYDLTKGGEGGVRLYSTRYDQALARSLVRSLFYPRRDVRIDIEEVGEVAFASFVDEESLNPVHGIPRHDFYPSEEDERKVLAADERRLPDGLQVAYDELLAVGKKDAAARILESQSMTPPITNAYQYIPYHFDSPFEMDFFVMVRNLNAFKDLGLEVYYNGDNSVADFRIDCFKKDGATWKKVGKYTPDFLIVRRIAGAIEKILIVETKGLGYSRERGFEDRRRFVEEVFVPKNNLRFGRERFEYKVLTDDTVGNELRRVTEEMLLACFG